MRTPTIHRNGTSFDWLKEAHLDALEAIRRAQTALQVAAPNGRDFYVQDGNATHEATEEHAARVRRLAEIEAELQEILGAIVDQEPVR